MEARFNPGDKVAYVSDSGLIENGIVKSQAPDGGYFVVYNCGGDWENYQNYTGAKTDDRDLVGKWTI